MTVRSSVLRSSVFWIALLTSTPCAAAQPPHWSKSIYFGASRAEDLGAFNDANFSAQTALYRTPERTGWAVGGELGVLGLGSMGFGTADVDGGSSASLGPAHYGSAFAGLGVRRMGRWGRRIRPYLGGGTAVHFLRAPGALVTSDTPVWVRPGISLSAGVYGFAPGHLGIEARTHLVPAGKGEGVGGPLVIYSIVAGFNDR